MIEQTNNFYCKKENFQKSWVNLENKENVDIHCRHMWKFIEPDDICFHVSGWVAQLFGHHVALVRRSAWEERRWGQGAHIWRLLTIDTVPILHLFRLKLREKLPCLTKCIMDKKRQMVLKTEILTPKYRALSSLWHYKNLCLAVFWDNTTRLFFILGSSKKYYV